MLTGLWAVLALPVFLASFAGAWSPALALDPVAWHSHELIFGFAGAALAGFLLTAVPNWTGRLPLRGGPLLLLVCVWLLARLGTMAVGAAAGALVSAVLVLAFPVVLLAVFAREIIAGGATRSLPLLLALLLLLLADAGLLAEARGLLDLEGAALRLGVAVFAALITLMGGRLVPSFTINWLKARGETDLPPGFGPFDRVALLCGVLALLLWVAWPQSPITAALAALACLLNAVRLARWRGRRTGPEPLLWVLHLGYLWLVLGYAALAASAAIDRVSQAAAVHVLTVGAMGTMILAVTSRATLGHTGRALQAGPGLTAAYLLVSAAALLRFVSALFGDASIALLWAATAGWVGAWLLFLLVCAPMLLLPRAAKAPSA